MTEPTSPTPLPTDDPQAAVAAAAAYAPPREPKYEWGLRVRAVTDLINDGSHPATAEGEMLVPAGAVGDIVRVGQIPDANLPVYLVEFAGGLLIGCLEDDIVPLAGVRASVPGRME